MSKGIHQMELEPEGYDLCKKAFMMAIRDALNVVSGKWTLAIISTLLSDPKGFADIERLLATISARLLSRELRDLPELEVNLAITRISVDGDAKDRRDSLTAPGKRLEPIVFMLAGWDTEHRPSSTPVQQNVGPKPSVGNEPKRSQNC